MVVKNWQNTERRKSWGKKFRSTKGKVTVLTTIDIFHLKNEGHKWNRYYAKFHFIYGFFCIHMLRVKSVVVQKSPAYLDDNCSININEDFVKIRCETKMRWIFKSKRCKKLGNIRCKKLIQIDVGKGVKIDEDAKEGNPEDQRTLMQKFNLGKVCKVKKNEWTKIEVVFRYGFEIFR